MRVLGTTQLDPIPSIRFNVFKHWTYEMYNLLGTCNTERLHSKLNLLHLSNLISGGGFSLRGPYETFSAKISQGLDFQGVTSYYAHHTKYSNIKQSIPTTLNKIHFGNINIHFDNYPLIHTLYIYIYIYISTSVT